MERKKFHIELIDYEKLNGLTEMFSLCFGKKPPIDYFSWKFLENPGGKAIGFVAYYEGKTAGFYGVIPEQYVINGEKVIVYQSMDTMTHPDYQRQGLFTKLATATYNYLIDKDGEVFIIGFPGLTSHPGFVKKLGWRNINLIDYIFLAKTVFTIKNMFSSNNKLIFNKISRFNDSFDDYFAVQKSKTNCIEQVIDRNILNWRIAHNKIFDYEIVEVIEGVERIGFVVYKLDEENRCFLHYVNFAEDDFYESYFGDVCRYLFEITKSNFLFTFEPSQPFMLNMFRKHWFIKNKFNKGFFSYKPPFIGFSNKEKIEGLDFFDKSNYDLQPIVRDY